MPKVKYIGTSSAQFGVQIDHTIYDIHPPKQATITLPSEREVVMLLSAEPDLWERVEEPTRTKKAADAESASNGTE